METELLYEYQHFYMMFIEEIYNSIPPERLNDWRLVLKEKIYNYLLTIPKGKVVTYKQIAEYLGNPKLSRVVGNVLHRNPNPNKYPCYKVVNSKGKLSSNFAFGGIEKQKDKLENEGIEVINYIVNLEKYQYKD